MKKQLLTVLVCCITICPLLQAQRIQEKGLGLINLNRHQATLGFGFRYELGLVRNLSISTSFTPGLAFAKLSESTVQTFDGPFTLTPENENSYALGLAWNIRIRYYLNFNTRLDINKNIVGNSADYVAPARTIFGGPLQLFQNFREDTDFATAFYGGVYGIQRTYRSGFNFNAEFGFGYYRGDGIPNGYGPLISFSLGWVVTKRKDPNKIEIKH